MDDQSVNSPSTAWNGEWQYKLLYKGEPGCERSVCGQSQIALPKSSLTDSFNRMTSLISMNGVTPQWWSISSSCHCWFPLWISHQHTSNTWWFHRAELSVWLHITVGYIAWHVCLIVALHVWCSMWLWMSKQVHMVPCCLCWCSVECVF